MLQAVIINGLEINNIWTAVKRFPFERDSAVRAHHWDRKVHIRQAHLGHRDRVLEYYGWDICGRIITAMCFNSHRS